MTAPTAFTAPPRPPAPRRSDSLDLLAARRTLLALVASAFGVLPLKALFSDTGWLVDVWLTMIVVLAPAALIRLRRAPGALDVWPGIILLVPWLTGRFVSGHALGGVIPTTATWHDLALLMTNLHQTTRQEVAPIHTTVAVRLVVCALLGLLAALIDLIAVVGRRGALAGVPLLVVYTVAGAVPRQPVSWVWFVFAAVGFLILLAVDAGDDLRTWGLRIATPGAGRARGALAVSTQRIALAAIVVAVLLPLLVPGEPRNLIANAFHNGGGDGVGGFGEGTGTAGISPFIALQGQLQRDTPIELMKVHMTSDSGTEPFYLRVNVLSKYSDEGWRLDDHGTTQDLDKTNFDTDPGGGGASYTSELGAQIDITGLSGNAPIFAVPTSLDGVDPDTTWSTKDQLILGSKVSRGQRINERFFQLTPSQAQLNAAGNIDDTSLDDDLSVPGGLPTYARNLLNKITAGAVTPYAKARAISDFFADPTNNFVYDLQTKQGDSPSALVNFLKNRVGYCQQYAAAMAVLLRASDVPARVVLGYMHPAPDAKGNFTVSTSDAHSWVEAYFSGIGWVPFDPTPTSGLSGGRKSDLSYAPHDYPKAGGTSAATSGAASSKAAVGDNKPKTAAAGPTQAAPAADAANTSQSWNFWPLLIIIAILALALIPALVRATRRRRRYAAARHGDADALWAELSDTAIDLGYVWSTARSPRQVAQWLRDEASTSGSALQALAVAVEQRRYSPDADTATRDTDGVKLSAGLREVTGQLRARRSGRTRLRALLLPPSLRWPTVSGRLGRLHRH